MSLHNEIMNIPTKSETLLNEVGSPLDYKLGHRDARHAAAELSLKYEHLIERLLDALERLHADDFVDSIRGEYNLYE
ncbi:hypothetical protein PHB09_019 [Pseudomonas phage PHB09]|uniref:Uncharacterized protein n=1 Tax=Pseudomonas phage PHB09 TaxID=2867265 RepID=A0AAE8XC82_9CAUD|nr:hypothetical protein QGX10_gp019 [Pseudomonas phage PHB09]UAV84515.1 hypothetical protein PHB09_019 [Pseudomonas phage PHB09]